MIIVEGNNGVKEHRENPQKTITTNGNNLTQIIVGSSITHKYTNLSIELYSILTLVSVRVYIAIKR